MLKIIVGLLFCYTTTVHAVVQIGGAYNTFSEHENNPCLNHRINWSGQFQTESYIQNPMEKDLFLQEFNSRLSLNGFSSALDITYGGFLSNLRRDNPNRYTLYYMVNINGLKAKVAQPQINPQFKSLTAEQFLARCGDAFIDEAEYGGLLAILIHMDFGNENEKKRFAFNTGLSYASLEDLVLNIERNEVKERIVEFTIQAIQIGGQPQKLYSLIDADVMTCSMQRLAQCKKISNKIVDYITKVGGFRDQIVQADREDILTWTPLKFTTKPYGTIDQVHHNWRWDDRLFSQKSNILQRLNEFQDGLNANLNRISLDVSGKNQSILSAMRQVVEEKRDQLINVANRCRGDYRLCLTEGSQNLAQIGTFKPAFVNFPPLHFVDLCMKPYWNEQAYFTLQKIAESKNLDMRDCENFFDTVNTLPILSLENKNIVDLTPFRSLHKIIHLNLAKNQIIDPSPLLHMSRLITLDLSLNPILNIADTEKTFHSIKNLYLFGNADPQQGRYVANFTQGKQHIFTNKQACEYQLEQLVLQQKLSRTDADWYKQMEFAPSIDDNGNLSAIDFFACDLVIWDYSFWDVL